MSVQKTPTTILSLPNELLVAIAAAGQEGRVADLDTTFNSKTEWTLSHISRRFRDVILGAPTLWTFVAADLEAEGSMEICKLYLERSKTCTISANFLYCALSVSQNLSDFLATMRRIDHIVPHIHRISWLRLRMESNELLAPLLCVAAPNLRHLEIFNPGYILVNLPCLFSSGAPKLIFVKIDGYTLLPAPPWTTSVTHLDIRGADDKTLHFAMQCPLLVHLHLDIYYWSRPRRRYHIPSLKSLYIKISDGEDELHLVALLDLIDTPALTKLIIDGTHGPQIIWLFAPIVLAHSFPALTSLYFVNKGRCSCEHDTEENMHVAPSITSPPLGLFPALSSLFLINQCFTSNAVEAIFGSASQPWPFLEAVTLSSLKEISNFNESVNVSSALQDAVRFNRQRGQALPRFKLSRDVLSQMEDWEEERVDAEIFDPTEIVNSLS
ncbi:hypothetical protein B0H19DRAFT_1098835 [Mycena capillaripes]|nr:hypothetical protein B0H19DRAFT_1098835 [Mycena capillaripes]